MGAQPAAAGALSAAGISFSGQCDVPARQIRAGMGTLDVFHKVDLRTNAVTRPRESLAPQANL
jgi:hypothetical protein